MSISRRERQRQATREEIKNHARQQMAESGTSALSLNAIARAMEITTPALYRYYASRDDLLTALILDGYNGFALWMEKTAEQSQNSAAPLGEQVLALLLAYREWALTHSVDFQLIFGNPIPGYNAPHQETWPAAQRAFEPLVRLLIRAETEGGLQLPPGLAQLPEGYELQMYQQVGEAFFMVSRRVAHAALYGWAMLHGLVSLELYNHTPNILSQAPGVYFRACMEGLVRQYGLLK